MARDEFEQRTKDILARRVGYRCSNPNCYQLTSGPHTESAKVLNIGVAAHISAAAPGGPRFDATLTPGQRKSSDNGLWLCQNCAKLIDNDTDRYTTALLLQWKKQSEDRARWEIENQRAGYTLIHTSDKQMEIALTSLDRIRREKHNFAHIIAGGEFKSPQHKKAVTEFSYELTTQAMLRLRRLPDFEFAVVDLLPYLQNKDAPSVLERIIQIESQLADFCDR